MKTHHHLITPALLAVIFPIAMPASGALVLFPGGMASEVQDGGPNDATGAVNGMIVIDPAFPIAVPGHSDLLFSGMVEHIPGGTPGSFGGVNGLRALRITGIPAGSGLPGAGQPATLTNGTSTTLNVAGPIRFVMFDYTTLDPAGNPGMGDLTMSISGDLDSVPGGGSIPNVGQRIGLSVRATTFSPSITGMPGDAASAAWTNTSPTTVTGPLPLGASHFETGDYNISVGSMIIEIDGLILGPNERFEFPASITAGAIIPEPSAVLLASLFPILACWRRRRG